MSSVRKTTPLLRQTIRRAGDDHVLAGRLQQTLLHADAPPTGTVAGHAGRHGRLISQLVAVVFVAGLVFIIVAVFTQHRGELFVDGRLAVTGSAAPVARVVADVAVVSGRCVSGGGGGRCGFRSSGGSCGRRCGGCSGCCDWCILIVSRVTAVAAVAAVRGWSRGCGSRGCGGRWRGFGGRRGGDLNRWSWNNWKKLAD